MHHGSKCRRHDVGSAGRSSLDDRRYRDHPWEDISLQKSDRADHRRSGEAIQDGPEIRFDVRAVDVKRDVAGNFKLQAIVGGLTDLDAGAARGLLTGTPVECRNAGLLSLRPLVDHAARLAGQRAFDRFRSHHAHPRAHAHVSLDLVLQLATQGVGLDFR